MHDLDRAGWAYHDANGKPLRGPCRDVDCRFASAPGGGDHVGAHSYLDGTTGWPHDVGYSCDCGECNLAARDDRIDAGLGTGYIGEFR
jgi:hypothetical protein